MSHTTVFARALCTLLFLILLACQQPYQQGRGLEENWCYFEDGNLLINRIAPKADDCEKKGGQWVTDGQASVLRQHNFKDSGADKAKRSGGTGFVISQQGHVLTNFHVVENCSEIRGNARTGTEGLTIVATDRINDLAVLKLKSFTGDVAKFRKDLGVRAGDSVIVVGYPLPGVLTSLANVTTGSVTALAGLLDDVRYYQISAPVQPGNSGGPVLDQSGNVIGVVASKLDALAVAKITGDIPQNINFAIKASVIQNFLRTHGINYQIARSNYELKPGEIGEKASEFTISLECWR